MPKTEMENFIGDLQGDQQVDQNVVTQEVTQDKTSEQEAPKNDDPRKNRHHRRLEEQLRQEREANIALAERVKVLSEVNKFTQETGGEVDPRLVRAFGTTDEGKEVARIFAETLKDVAQKTKEETLKEIEQRSQQERAEQQKYESVIDDQLENLEDTYNVDLTSDTPSAKKSRKEFLELVQKLSPKDEDGTITSYADFGSAFEIYQSTRSKDTQTTSRQKEIASRSMQTSSGVTTGERSQMDEQEKWLVQNGIIKPRRR